MGLSGSHLQLEHKKDLSPWSTEVIVVNNMQTPVLILESRSHTEPSPEDAIEHHVPPGEHAIFSGYLHNEPRVTLYVRTGLHSAKVLRVPNAARIMVSNKPHGLHVESQDENVDIEDVKHPEVIPGTDTIPMLLRNEHFKDVSSESVRSPAAGGA
eukprot:TRINITY_DN40222_c0_g1_i1.p1 TRINITY_DN40222_c0_g1~~TRINITY_DN40222_c0_g1_i1.p1  ORF type:complete len:155 (-),score=14.82 TRINITY_DN40222_c0_g1_i1:77-541(-)